MITTEFIFIAAILVFLLMVIGIILTMQEFNKLTDDPSVRKGAGSGVKPVSDSTPHRHATS